MSTDLQNNVICWVHLRLGFEAGHAPSPSTSHCSSHHEHFIRARCARLVLGNLPVIAEMLQIRQARSGHHAVHAPFFMFVRTGTVNEAQWNGMERPCSL